MDTVAQMSFILELLVLIGNIADFRVFFYETRKFTGLLPYVIKITPTIIAIIRRNCLN